MEAFGSGFSDKLVRLYSKPLVKVKDESESLKECPWMHTQEWISFSSCQWLPTGIQSVGKTVLVLQLFLEHRPLWGIMKATVQNHLETHRCPLLQICLKQYNILVCIYRLMVGHYPQLSIYTLVFLTAWLIDEKGYQK